jgi:superfamily II DNA/RNA helicase
MSFNSLGLSDALLKAIKENTPSPIQQKQYHPF